jgi:hypothetical protein
VLLDRYGRLEVRLTFPPRCRQSPFRGNVFLFERSGLMQKLLSTLSAVKGAPRFQARIKPARPKL